MNTYNTTAATSDAATDSASEIARLYQSGASSTSAASAATPAAASATAESAPANNNLLFPQYQSNNSTFKSRFEEMQASRASAQAAGATPSPASAGPAPAAAPLASNVETPTTAAASVFSCTLPKGMSFKGDAHFPCDVKLEGMFEGKLTAEPNKTITITQTGDATGEFKATNIRLEGKASGHLTADGGLASFGHKAVYAGQLTYGRLGIEEGAEVDATMKKIPVTAR